MNFVTVCAQLREDPREVYTSATSTAVRCSVTLPPYNGKKAPTEIELTVYGQQQGERFRSLKKGTGVYIHGAKLQYDLETRTFSLHGGVVTPVNVEQFPILKFMLPKSFGPKLPYGAFMETLRVTNEAHDDLRDKLLAVLDQMEATDWSAYDYAVNLVNEFKAHANA